MMGSRMWKKTQPQEVAAPLERRLAENFSSLPKLWSFPSIQGGAALPGGGGVHGFLRSGAGLSWPQVPGPLPFPQSPPPPAARPGLGPGSPREAQGLGPREQMLDAARQGTLGAWHSL